MEKIINVHGINMEIYFIIYLMILISNRNIGIFCINLFGVKIVCLVFISREKTILQTMDIIMVPCADLAFLKQEQ